MLISKLSYLFQASKPKTIDVESIIPIDPSILLTNALFVEGIMTTWNSEKIFRKKIFRNGETPLIEITEFGSDREFPTINGRPFIVGNSRSEPNSVISINGVSPFRNIFLRNIFSEFQVVIIPSTNKAFVSKILGSIGIMDSTSIVFGLDAWKRYDNLDINNLMELDVHLPISNGFSYSREHDKSFLRLFEIRHNTNQAKYSHIAYNIIMHFCSDFTTFQFKRVSGGGKVNIRSPLFNVTYFDM